MLSIGMGGLLCVHEAANETSTNDVKTARIVVPYVFDRIPVNNP